MEVPRKRLFEKRKTLSVALRSESEIMLNVASSGIVSLLLT